MVLPIYIICLIFIELVTNIKGQTCPDGFPAAFKCTASKKSKNGYYCKEDENLGCEVINGIFYCCDLDKSDSVSASPSNETEVSKKTRKNASKTLAPKKSKAVPTTTKKSKKLESDEEETTKIKKTTSGCFDRGSECGLRANLCNNPIYDALMRQQCPSTCRRCQQPSDSDFGEEEPTSGSDCVDRGPDCQKLPYLCENPNYVDLMREECPLTCNKC